MDLVDSFERNDSLPLDLLDTDGFFSTEQLGVSELDMAGLSDLVSLETRLGVPEPESDWEAGGDVNLNCGDPSGASLTFSDIDHQLADTETNSSQDCLDEDFQKMLSEWESHIVSLTTPAPASPPPSPVRSEEPPAASSSCGSLSLVSRSSSRAVSLSSRLNSSSLPVRLGQARSLPVSGLRSPVVPRPGVTYTRLAGVGPRATRISSVQAISPIRSPPASPPSPPTNSRDWFLAPASSCPPVNLPETIRFSSLSSDLTTRELETQKKRMLYLESNLNRNRQQSQGSLGSSSHSSNPSVKIIAAVSPGKDGQSTTRILSSRNVKETLPRELIEKIKAASQGRKTIAIIEPVNKEREVTVARGFPASSQPKWRHVGIVSPLVSHNISDHDYCSPGKQQVGVVRAVRPARCREAGGGRAGRDSGLESDGSEGSEDSLYDKLPPYLTSVSVQTSELADQQQSYSRVPCYLTTTPRHRLSVLKHHILPVKVETQAEDQADINTKDTESHGVSRTGGEGEVRSRERDRERRPRRRRDSGDSRSSSSGSRKRSGSYRSRSIRSHDRSKDRKEKDKKHQKEKKSQVDDRRVIYCGKIQEGTLKSDLRTRFQVFGPVTDVSLHFRERGDNYGFITFENKDDAYTAVERGNDDTNLPIYDLCFGGRRAFCKEKYFDLDYVEEENSTNGEMDFDELLASAARGTNSS